MARSSYTTFLTTINGTVPAVSANPKRSALLLGGPSSGSIFWGTEPSVANGRGLIHASGGPVIALSFLVHGECVRQAWYFGSAVAGNNVSVVECFDDDVFGTFHDYMVGIQQ